MWDHCHLIPPCCHRYNNQNDFNCKRNHWYINFAKMVFATGNCNLVWLIRHSRFFIAEKYITWRFHYCIALNSGPATWFSGQYLEFQYAHNVPGCSGTTSHQVLKAGTPLQTLISQSDYYQMTNETLCYYIQTNPSHFSPLVTFSLHECVCFP